MSNLRNFLELIQSFSFRVGKVVCIIALAIISLDHWKIFSFTLFPIPNLVDYMYAYLVITAIVSGSVLYLDHKKQPSIAAICPKCNAALKADIHYVCPSCGKLEFKPNDPFKLG